MTQLDLDGLRLITTDSIIPRIKAVYAEAISQHLDGQILKEAGIAATLAAERTAWRERAIELLGNYAKLAKRPFPMEEFRGAWTELGYGEPHAANCWGAITQTACARGLIEPTGDWVQSKHPKAHRRYTRLWRAV